MPTILIHVFSFRFNYYRAYLTGSDGKDTDFFISDLVAGETESGDKRQ